MNIHYITKLKINLNKLQPRTNKGKKHENRTRVSAVLRTTRNTYIGL